MWTTQKAMEEGTAEPFIARLMFGILTLRDGLIQARMSSQTDVEAKREEFDNLYGPVLDAMFIMRKAATAIRDMISEHERKVTSGEIIGWQRNALEIHESINSQLQDDLGRFLNSAARAIKSLQAVMSHLGLNIGGLFAKGRNYERQMNVLEANNHAQLAQYLRQCRTEWSERLVARRNAFEHEGWTLGAVQYSVGPDQTVRMSEPTIDSQEVSEWVAAQAAHVIAFVEDVLVYALQQALPPDLTIVEIPSAERHPKNPGRFRLAYPRIEAVAPWSLR
jgi:hypothetical protein